ncbi:MAG: outer membrane lipoprotein chaperone LolA [Lautropia sp.]|nr:outer membrane lipoprotein chaperone LolA [Lautropia sp.]
MTISACLARCLLTAACGLGGLLAATAPSSALAAGAIDQLKEFSRTTRSARGDFTQQLIKQSGQAAAPARGGFAFARPGRFRWEIQSPYQQLIVTDGSMLHFYDKDLKQVTVRKADDAISATPAAVLFGGADLESAFSLKEEGERDGLQWVEALPKVADSGFDRIRVGMRDGLPAEMEVKDAFGQVNRFTFTRISRNAAVADSDFSFTPPPGVDVIQ